MSVVSKMMGLLFCWWDLERVAVAVSVQDDGVAVLLVGFGESCCSCECGVQDDGVAVPLVGFGESCCSCECGVQDDGVAIPLVGFGQSCCSCECPR